MTSLITLDVSGHKFRTTTATLKTSPYFFALLTRWEASSDKQEDGSYFVDADPEIFKHLLDYIRRPSHFPLFWTKESGFDYVLYQKLEAEAAYFLLDDLRDWIRDKRYLEAVKTAVKAHTLDIQMAVRAGSSKVGYSENWKGDAKIEVHCVPVAGAELQRDGCMDHEHKNYVYRNCVDCVKYFRPPKDPETQVIVVGTLTEFDTDVCVNKKWEAKLKSEVTF